MNNLDFYKNKTNNFIFISFLLFINILAHLIPFERASIAPDDFAFMLQSRGFEYFLYEPHRPLQYIWFEIQSYIIGDNGYYGLILILFPSLGSAGLLYFL